MHDIHLSPARVPSVSRLTNCYGSRSVTLVKITPQFKLYDLESLQAVVNNLITNYTLVDCVSLMLLCPVTLFNVFRCGNRKRCRQHWNNLLLHKTPIDMNYG